MYDEALSKKSQGGKNEFFQATQEAKNKAKSVYKMVNYDNHN